MDVVGLLLIVALVGALGLAAGGRSRDDVRARGRWDAAFEHESRRLQRTDATGVLRCRSCGSSALERHGSCPQCGAVL